MLRYLNLFISLIFGLFLIQDTQLHSAEDTAFVASDFQLYYGGDNTLLDKLQHRMRKGQVVVIELRGLDQKQVSLSSMVCS